MIASTYKINSKNFALVTCSVLQLLSHKTFIYKQKIIKNVKNSLLFKKITKVYNYEKLKYLEYKIFRILFKQISNCLSVVFQFS